VGVVTGYDALEELLDDLPTLRYPKPRPPKAKKVTSVQRTVVAGDFHFGISDQSTHDILFQVIKDWKPTKVVLAGDLPDMLALSKYPKDLRTTWSLADERKEMADFLWTLHDVAPQADLVELDANHSGNGPESRWWRYLSDRIGELASMKEVIDGLDYRAIWHPEFSRVRVESVEQLGHAFVAVHGDVVRGQAGASALAMLNKWRCNLIHGHTHRMGATAYRVPGIAGQSEHQLRAWENGCMCSLKPVYSSAVNWQQGFSLVTTDEDGAFGIEQVLVHQGRAVSTTLGGSYRA